MSSALHIIGRLLLLKSTRRSQIHAGLKLSRKETEKNNRIMVHKMLMLQPKLRLAQSQYEGGGGGGNLMHSQWKL